MGAGFDLLSFGRGSDSWEGLYYLLEVEKEAMTCKNSAKVTPRDAHAQSFLERLHV